jgi:hypothetical protein
VPGEPRSAKGTAGAAGRVQEHSRMARGLKGRARRAQERYRDCRGCREGPGRVSLSKYGLTTFKLD